MSARSVKKQRRRSQSPSNVDDVIVDDVKVTSIAHQTRVTSVHAHVKFRGRASKTKGVIEGFSIFEWDFAFEFSSSLNFLNPGRPCSEKACIKIFFPKFPG